MAPPSPPWTPSWWSFPVTTPFGAPTAGDPLRPHLGVDFAAPMGSPVQSGGVGSVTKVFSDQQGGTQVMVKYAQGGTGWFAHLNDVLVNIGDKVTPASVIGHSGNSGTVTGPHLHFQLLNQSGQSVDPFGALNFSKLVSENGSFRFSGDCPTGWHHGNEVGAAFCVPDGLMFGGGDPAKNAADAVKAVAPNVTLPTFTLPGLGVPVALTDFLKPENLWRAGFIALGALAIFLGGRMYLADPEAPSVSVRESVGG